MGFNSGFKGLNKEQTNKHRVLWWATNKHF